MARGRSAAQHHAFLKRQGDARHLRIAKIPAHRGMLLDRNGEPLAASTPVASVWINPKELADSRARWTELEGVLGLGQGTIEQLAEERGRARIRLPAPPRRSAGRRGGRAMEMAGVHLQHEYRRYYPMGAVAGHVIGFTNVDDAGQEGLELAFNDELSGKSGRKRVIRDRLGRIVENVERISPAHPGRDLVLSIDRRIQSVTHRALLQGVQHHRAEPAPRWSSTCAPAKCSQWPTSRPSTRTTAPIGRAGAPQPRDRGPAGAGLHRQAVHGRRRARSRDRPSGFDPRYAAGLHADSVAIRSGISATTASSTSPP